MASDPRVGLPPGGFPAAEKVLGVENYISPEVGLNQNPFDTQKGVVPPAAPLRQAAGTFTSPYDQNKQFYDRVPPSSDALPGWTKDQSRVPPYPGSAAAGTYTTPYDVPATPPFRLSKGQEDIPSEYADKYLSPPAQTYSDNPVQGPSNPSQEPEDPRTVKERQIKYGETGATIGGIVAGPIGTVIGGLFGYQYGKTSPNLRRQIASNPEAVRQNVTSINQMIDNVGGTGRNMHVTEGGFRTAMASPETVLAQPELFTTTEQMLAALALGVDPKTGKPIT
jgi:hypothetical protein